MFEQRHRQRHVRDNRWHAFIDKSLSIATKITLTFISLYSHGREECRPGFFHGALRYGLLYLLLISEEEHDRVACLFPWSFAVMCSHLGCCTVFEEEDDPSRRSFFSEIISSIADIKFSRDGRYILSRCVYMHICIANIVYIYVFLWWSLYLVQVCVCMHVCMYSNVGYI